MACIEDMGFAGDGLAVVVPGEFGDLMVAAHEGEPREFRRLAVHHLAPILSSAATTCCDSTAWPLPARKPAQRLHLLSVSNCIDGPVLVNRGRRCVHVGSSRSRKVSVNTPPSPVHPVTVRVNSPSSPVRSLVREAAGSSKGRLCTLFLRCRNASANRGIFPKTYPYFRVIGVFDLRKRCVTPTFPLARKSALRGVFCLRCALQSPSLRKHPARLEHF